MSRNVTVWALPVDGKWAAFGTTTGRGIRAENVTLTADRWGSLDAKFDLRRDPRVQWPDLGAFTPIDIEVDGVRVWSGRVSDTPARDGADRTMSVQCRGWQFHLDDRPIERFYVHNRLADWKDTRSVPGSGLTFFRQGAQVTSDLGQTVLSFPAGYVSPAATCFVGITLDVGPGMVADSISIDWESSNNAADVFLYARGGSPLAANDAVAGVALNTGASGTSTGAFPTDSRIVNVFLYYGGAGPVTFTADVWMRLKEIRVFASSAYASGGASVLKGSQVVADVAAFPELLSTDLSAIEATSFNIPDYAPLSAKTPREHITAVNAYEDAQAMVDVDRRVVYRPLPTAPLFEAGSWAGFEFDDASANSGEEIYNVARIEAVQPDGTPLRFDRESTADTLVTRREFTRGVTLPVRSALTQAAGERVADTWLSGHETAPLKGKARAVGQTAVRGLSGEPIPPHILLLRTGELLRLNHIVNPVTGGWGRDGRIALVTYTPAEDRAEIDIDNTRALFDAQLARFDAIVGGT